MARRGTWLAIGIGASLLALAAGAAWATWEDDLRYRHALERFDDSGTSRANRFVNLEEGDAQLSYGSPDGERIVVQWRDPDGRGWTEPETVWRSPGEIAGDSTLRYGGGTAAFAQLYASDPELDYPEDELTVAVVCRDLTCSAERTLGYAGIPQVTPDGRAALLMDDEVGVLLWSAEAGFRRVAWSGHPGSEWRVNSNSDTLLAPDGSLRLVASRPSRSRCTFELLASAPGTADLAPVARQSEPLLRGTRSECRSSLETFSTDWVGVKATDHRTRDLWFVRDGKAWGATHEDVSGRVSFRRPGDRCCPLLISEFVHWNQLASGSPDGRRLLVQSHLMGEETWGEPELFDPVPAGFRCRHTDGQYLGKEGSAVWMYCPPTRGGGSREPAFAVAASPDLRTWDYAFVREVGSSPTVEGDRLRVGRSTWTPEDGWDHG